MKNMEMGITQEAFQMIVSYIDEIKEVLAADLWNNIFLNSSKNEVLIFWLLYQKDEVNMSEIADYIHVPLNTATGIVNRMEKNQLINRTRSKEDKRVVLIEFSEKGREQFQNLVSQLIYYGTKIMNAFSKEEMDLFFKMIEKVKTILKEDKKKTSTTKTIRKITIE